MDNMNQMMSFTGSIKKFENVHLKRSCCMVVPWAATMMSVLAKDIPVNVKGIIENCGFASIDEQLRFTYSQTVVPALPPAIKNQLDIIGDQEHEDLFMGLLKQYYFDQGDPFGSDSRSTYDWNVWFIA